MLVYPIRDSGIYLLFEILNKQFINIIKCLHLNKNKNLFIVMIIQRVQFNVVSNNHC